jgi:[FeFe] hydrogenase H-cluster maturation GTPase HydF
MLLGGGSIMQKTPKGLRLHIGIFGRRNVGKSSLLNALTRQQVSIVSAVAGTTTDPVEKPMELLPLGPVTFIDTAGIDDIGALGGMRVERTRQVFERADLAVLVAQAGEWGEFEQELLEELTGRQIGIVVVFNKSDLLDPEPEVIAQLDEKKIPWVKTVAIYSGEAYTPWAGTDPVENECPVALMPGIVELREALIRSAPEDWVNTPSILSDLVPAGEMAVLVIPIDKEAPKGRIILPQVQAIRDLLDHDSYCVVVKENGLKDAIERLNRPPALVVTDSQAFKKVAADTPDDVPLTGFSVLFARFKGDLLSFVKGALAIEDLKPGDRILVAESCSHHPIHEDIGRVKIPNWLRKYIGGDLEFEHVQGHDFPEDLSPYKLVIHCGACMSNRREILSRILHCETAGVPITNYGIAIAYSLNLFERALAPFPEAIQIYRDWKASRAQ